MAELVGTVSAALTLVEVIVRTSTATAQLCNDIRDSPAELNKLLQGVSSLQSYVQILSNLESRFPALSSEVLQPREYMLDRLNSLVLIIEERCEKYKAADGIRRQISIARNKVWIQRCLAEVDFLQGHLSLYILSLIALNQDQRTQSSEGDATTTVTPYEQPARSVPAQARGPVSSTQSYTRSSFLGQFAMVKKLGQTQWRNTLSYRAMLPFSTYGIKLKLNSESGSFWLLPRLNYDLHFPRVIESDSLYIEACKNGLLPEAQSCWENGIARPDDITKENMTPLLYAVQSGNCELVDFLLHQGVNANQSAGFYDTSPLQWAIRHNWTDIVRTLLRHGASFQHVSNLGWSPLFYCWTEVRKTDASLQQAPDMSSTIQMINNNTILEFNEADIQNWTALERACSYGRSSDLDLLQKLGADMLAPRGPLMNRPIHAAIYSGNLNTYTWLCEQHGDVNDIRDARGWSLLHHAAQMGHENIITDLLKRGADPLLKTRASQTAMKAVLRGRQCTPEDVARAYGSKKYEKFLKVFAELGLQNKLQEVTVSATESSRL